MAVPERGEEEGSDRLQGRLCRVLENGLSPESGILCSLWDVVLGGPVTWLCYLRFKLTSLDVMSTRDQVLTKDSIRL